MRTHVKRGVQSFAVCAAAVVASALVAGCPPTPPPPEPNIVEVAQDTPELSTFVQALEAAQLTATLSTVGPFTVFAPNNDAFNALPAVVLNDLLLPANRGRLTEILLGHIVAGNIQAADLTDGQTLIALNGNALTVEIDGDVITVDGARIVQADLEASNGVIHIIDKVILPDIVETVLENPSLARLAAVVAAADLTDALKGTDPFTVFAPNNRAFEDLPEGMLEDLLLPANRDLLIDLLEGHVVEGVFLGGELTDGLTLTALNGDTLTVTVADNGSILINDALVVQTNIITANGVIHIIDAVLLPDVVQTIGLEKDLSTLAKALDAADLEDDLAAPGPFTVFAPNNQAFEDLPAGVLADLLLPGNQAELVEVLQGHVVAGRFLAADLSNGQILIDLNGNAIIVSVDNGTVSVDGAVVVKADIIAGNGVIQIVDAVLLPPEDEEQ